jgi:hypothetical protein
VSQQQWGQVVVGTVAVQITGFTNAGIVQGMRILARSGNTGNVYVGGSSAITTTSGSNLVGQGAPNASSPVVVTADHLTANGQVWLIADGANQTVDWSVK